MPIRLPQLDKRAAPGVRVAASLLPFLHRLAKHRLSSRWSIRVSLLVMNTPRVQCSMSIALATRLLQDLANDQ